MIDEKRLKISVESVDKNEKLKKLIFKILGIKAELFYWFYFRLIVDINER